MHIHVHVFNIIRPATRKVLSTIFHIILYLRYDFHLPLNFDSLKFKKGLIRKQHYKI